MTKNIIMLVGPGNSAKFMYNGIKDEFKINKIIRAGFPWDEKIRFLKRRAKRLGYWHLYGQILFQVCCVRMLKFFSKKRINELKKDLYLSDEDFDDNKLIDVPSVNSDDCLNLLKQIHPHIVIVHGTQIITKKILGGVGATFLNTHAGITPKYRGVHGGYWALANNDKENCGTTVHLVDSSIDGGNILYQERVGVTKKDNFTTYPYLQMAVGIKLMKLALYDLVQEKVSPKKTDIKGKLWYHPTLWEYLQLRISKGIK